VAYVVAANPGSLARAASLLIGDQTYQVIQAAGPGVIPTSYTSALYTGPNIGFAGDGGPVGSASVSGPEEMVFDGSGKLYIADSYNARIRESIQAGLSRPLLAVDLRDSVTADWLPTLLSTGLMALP
jgi:hypothetical protein